jgi:hypothetical protein
MWISTPANSATRATAVKAVMVLAAMAEPVAVAVLVEARLERKPMAATAGLDF